MKKTLAMILASTMALSMLASCGGSGTDGGTTTPPADGGTSTPAPSTPDVGTDSGVPATGIELQVVTSYGGNDGNRTNYVDAYTAFELATGHLVKDASATSDEAWKAQVASDFETGSEPHVLFYFTGADADSFVNGEKVVSIEEIRAEYPDYATNMKDEMLPLSTADGQAYAVPVNGFWEGLFVNKTVLEAAGVEVPGAGYDWNTFLNDCQKIKEAGYTPIAAALSHVPHYWFEFSVLNHGTVGNHTEVATSSTDEAGTRWTRGLDDLKVLYDMGFFPSNTLTSQDEETFQLFMDGDAAFLIDGSWKTGTIAADAANVDDFTVTYVPGKEDRAATDIIGGISMGYYITQKAWDDPEYREAAVDFVTAMTADDVVAKFSTTAITALATPPAVPEGLNSLEQACVAMSSGASGVVSPVQDGLPADASGALMAGIQDVVTGGKTSAQLVDEILQLG